VIYGWHCLILMPYVLLSPYWYANPVYFAAVFLSFRGRCRSAALAGLVAGALALMFFGVVLISNVKNLGSLLPLPGAWLWLLSIWRLTISARRGAIRAPDGWRTTEPSFEEDFGGSPAGAASDAPES
jgi:hypothetical protein